MKRPLDQMKVLVTREISQAKAFSKEIALRSGIPVEVPLLKIRCLKHKEDKPIWERLSVYSWAFFTSANGVTCFFDQLDQEGIDRSILKKKKIAAVGHKTEKVLKEYGFTADFIPTIYDADTMAKEFLRQYPIARGPFLLIRGNRSRDVLPEVFGRQNISFDSLEVYETTSNDEMASTLIETLQNNTYDFITFTSPSAATIFTEFGGKEIVGEDALIACIGTTTERKVKELGFNQTIVPDEFTIEGMIESMEQYVQRG